MGGGESKRDDVKERRKSLEGKNRPDTAIMGYSSAALIGCAKRAVGTRPRPAFLAR
jgi:hypothetical protein